MAPGRDVQLISATREAPTPTQMTVGFREVEAERRHWQSPGTKARRAWLEPHGFPAVLPEPADDPYRSLAGAHAPEARYLPGWSGVFEARR